MCGFVITEVNLLSVTEGPGLIGPFSRDCRFRDYGYSDYFTCSNGPKVCGQGVLAGIEVNLCAIAGGGGTECDAVGKLVKK